MRIENVPRGVFTHNEVKTIGAALYKTSSEFYRDAVKYRLAGDEELFRWCIKKHEEYQRLYYAFEYLEGRGY